MRSHNIQFLLVLVVWLMYQGVLCYSPSFPCFSCACRNISGDAVFADCSNRNLTAIPDDLPENTICLDLTDNNIVDLNSAENSFINLRNLSVLSLSGNRLHKLEKNDLKQFEHLDKLDLSLNQIRYDQIADDAFDLVPHLIYLDVKQDTQNHTAQDDFTIKALRTLTKLKVLMIDIVNMDKLGDEFRNLTNLEELYLSGSYGHCHVPLIRQSFFANVNISSTRNKPFNLFMSNCSIEYIENGTLVPLKHLTTLDLSWNQNLTFKPLQNVTADLGSAHGRSILYLNFNSVHKYFELNQCIMIHKALMLPLSNTTLQLLSAESNRIINMDIGVVQHFPKDLKYLSLRDNMFLLGKYMKYAKTHGVLNNLIYFDAAAMFKTHTQPTPIANQRKRRSTTNVCQAKVDETFSFVNAHAKSINTCCNAILRRFKEYDFVAEILGRVKGLNASLNVSSTTHGSRPQRGRSSNGNIDSRNSSRLFYLDVSENFPGSVNISIGLFQNLTDLLFLNMSLNLYGYVHFSEENASIFQNTKKLKVLDMSCNRMMSIWYNAFLPLSNLERLYLSNNQLDKVELALDHMTKLSYIDFSNNRIDTINMKFRDSFNKLSNVSINLSENLLKCSCSDSGFVKWIQTDTRVNFVDGASYTCMFDNNTRTVINNINLSEWDMECDPSKYKELILAVSLSLVVFCVILIGGLAYRFRWNLRYLYYMTKYKMFGGYAAVREDNESEYEKDIFISYASEDSAFVRNCLMPHLQEFSLLIHERDFEAGQYVADNIMKAVSTTRKTLAILTKDYIRSKWCKHEMNMARLQGLDTGKEILCVIFMEDIPLNNVPLEIMDILREKTYLEYPHEEEHQAQFWERLNKTLKH